MSILLDYRTILFFNGFTAFAMFICMGHLVLRRRISPGFKLWTWAALANSAGYVLASLHQNLPDWITETLAISLTVLAGILICRGLDLFCGRRRSAWWDLAALMAFSAYLFFIEPSISVRIVMVSLVIGLVYLRAMILVVGPVGRLLGERTILLVESFGLISLLALLRALATWIWGDRGIAGLEGVGPYHSLLFLAMIAAHITMMVGLISANSRRLENELTSAMREIKTLRGIIPICSTCKKIRDDHGYWQQVESYVRMRTHAEFTHSICPDCLEIMYPDFKVSHK
jgi:hypothetical protein